MTRLKWIERGADKMECTNGSIKYIVKMYCGPRHNEFSAWAGMWFLGTFPHMQVAMKVCNDYEEMLYE